MLSLWPLGHPITVSYSYGSINLHSPLTPTLVALSPWLTAGALLAATVLMLFHFRRTSARSGRQGGTAGRATLAQRHPLPLVRYTLLFLMLFVVLLLFKEPRRADEGETASLSQVGRNFLTVLSNPQFMIFLLIFTGYWIVFWQEFIALPLYISAYIDPKADTSPHFTAVDRMIICSPVGHRVFRHALMCYSPHSQREPDQHLNQGLHT